ncbi:MAG: ABC transporter ATP-binding protein [Sphingorhabdus sp.]
MTEASMPVIAAESLSYRIGERPILNKLCFSQVPGEHLLLLGPSGAGKTSLINLITGLASPTEGRVLVAGEAMSSLPGSARDDLRRRTIGVVFQSLRLVSALTVRANLRLAQKLSGAPRDDADIARLIDAVGISHRADAKPRTLSQGEAQRAAIARALVGKPRLVIADEPTSALDDANTERIGQLLLDTAEANGSTLLIATHDVRLKKLFPNRLELTPLAEAA